MVKSEIEPEIEIQSIVWIMVALMQFQRRLKFDFTGKVIYLFIS